MTLKDRIRQQILLDGPLPFERFMEMALYDPDHGFFGSGKLRSEMAGDFLTSPEVSALFGSMLARFVNRERDRVGEPFEIVEVAAGSGSLLRALLSEVDVPATAVEISPAARTALTEMEGVVVLDGLPDSIRGVIIANELMDNLPMALAQKINGRWRERWVGLDDAGLSFVDAPPRDSVAAWIGEFAGEVHDGGWVEVQLAASRWLADALARLEQGSILIADYGDTTEGLVPRRQDGTLRTYRSHHLGPHPLEEPGETDITADVNFSALVDTARSAGAEVGLYRQDDFLGGLGLRERLAELRAAALQAARDGDTEAQLSLKTLVTEAETLLHPRGLGDFRVLVASK